MSSERFTARGADLELAADGTYRVASQPEPTMADLDYGLVGLIENELEARQLLAVANGPVLLVIGMSGHDAALWTPEELLQDAYSEDGVSLDDYGIVKLRFGDPFGAMSFEPPPPLSLSDLRTEPTKPWVAMNQPGKSPKPQRGNGKRHHGRKAIIRRF